MKVTTKNLMKAFPKLNTREAYHIMKLCNGNRKATEPVEGLESASDAAMQRINECYNAPTSVDVILHAINAVLGGYGVEAVPWEVDAMRDGEFIEYVNRGDPYTTTILHNPDTQRFEISDWGSLYEESPACHSESHSAEVESEDSK